MTFRSIAIRLIIIVLLTWIIGAIAGSFWLGLNLTVLPFFYWEVLRPR